jgi:hypothetical protein
VFVGRDVDRAAARARVLLAVFFGAFSVGLARGGISSAVI